MTTPAPASTARAVRHTTGAAVAWAAIGYALAAAGWVVAAAGVVAAGEAEGLGDTLSWFFTGLGVVGIAAAGAAVLFVPVLAAETLLWRFVTHRFGRFEADYLGVAQGAALLAVPWVLFNPLETPWSGLVTFAAMFIGLFAARLLVPALRPGALLEL
jgi:hypothetical protein